MSQLSKKQSLINIIFVIYKLQLIELTVQLFFDSHN